MTGPVQVTQDRRLIQIVQDQRLVQITQRGIAGPGLKKVYENIGDGASLSFQINHDMGTYDVLVEVMQSAGNRETRIADVARPNVNYVVVSFKDPPSVGQYRIAVFG